MTLITQGQIDGTDAVLRPYRDGQKTPSARDVQHVLALYDAEITELDEKIAPLSIWLMKTPLLL